MDFNQARFNMVAQQVRPWYIFSMPLLDAMMEIPRERFVTEDQQGLAYAEPVLPLPNGGEMLEPVIAARLIENLSLKSNDKVLEIGTGSGYVTAILSKLVESIFTVDIDEEQQERAKKVLASLSLHNIQFKVADGLQGVTDKAPYDAILVGGSCRAVPELLKNQLADGGRMMVIVGQSPLMYATLVTREGDSFKEKIIFDTLAAPLKSTDKSTQPAFSF